MSTVSDIEIAAKIMVIGIGGAGSNTVNSMISEHVDGVTYVCLNTDKQDIEQCKAENKIQLGKKLTKGLGAGSNPEIGEQAAYETQKEIEDLIQQQDMLILTCGMGGGTGTGATPVVAKLAKKFNILTVGVVTKPFTFEGKIRTNNARIGIDNLKQYVDTMIVISNNMLLKIVDKHTSITQAFRESDKILAQTIYGITGLINKPALINLDFADVTTIMKNRGIAYIGIGTGTGINAAMKAVEAALVSPLLETDIRGASHVLLNFTGDIALLDINDAASKVQSTLAPDAEIIFGADYNADLHEQVVATIIATGL